MWVYLYHRSMSTYRCQRITVTSSFQIVVFNLIFVRSQLRAHHFCCKISIGYRVFLFQNFNTSPSINQNSVPTNFCWIQAMKNLKHWSYADTSTQLEFQVSAQNKFHQYGVQLPPDRKLCLRDTLPNNSIIVSEYNKPLWIRCWIPKMLRSKYRGWGLFHDKASQLPLRLVQRHR